MGQELDRQAGVVPLSDRFAEMGGIPVNDDDGEQVEPGHVVVLLSLERSWISPWRPIRRAFMST